MSHGLRRALAPLLALLLALPASAKPRLRLSGARRGGLRVATVPTFSAALGAFKLSRGPGAIQASQARLGTALISPAPLPVSAIAERGVTPAWAASAEPVKPRAGIIPLVRLPDNAAELPASLTRPDSALSQLRATLTGWLKRDPGGRTLDGSRASPVLLSASARDDGPLRPKSDEPLEGEAPPPSGRVAGYSFDLDGNVFGKKFPTKIFLYKKQGGLQLELLSADFALIEDKVGTDYEFAGVNLKDYEIRQDRPDGDSYRNFKGGQLLENLTYAIKYLKKADWQGPSWHAMIHALNDAETAAWMSVNSKRRHSRVEFMAMFEHLRDIGYTQYLPELENLNSSIDAAEKVRHQVEKLDRIQAQAFGPDANKVLNADGTAKAVLHTDGFSDDTWANYEAMRASLAAAMRAQPGRWDKVKIVLYFTGANDPKHPPGAEVLKRDGTTRPLNVDERGDAFVRHLESPGAHADPRYKKLPRHDDVRSFLASVNAAIKKMFVSHSYGNTDPDVVDGDDLLARERQAIRDFIADKNIPDNEKHIVLTRYSIDDEELAQDLLSAYKAGAQVSLIVDFNVSMDFEFKEGQKPITDFSRATLKDNRAGAFIRTLLDGGFQIVSNGSTEQPRAAIYSQPLYNKGDPHMDPIMHEKSLLLVRKAHPGSGEDDQVVAYWFGTANMAAGHGRYNRLFLIDEPLSAAYALRHAHKIMAAFRAGKAIADIESEPPLRVWFEDESFMETAYSNGKYNPWDRAVEVLKRGTLEKSWLSLFFLTNSNLISALKEALLRALGILGRAFAKILLFGVIDDKSVPVHGYGKAAILDGFMTAPPRGRNQWGWTYELAQLTDLYDYLRGVEGVIETDQEGPPVARHLWHDKTGAFDMREERSERWHYLFTGSFNASNHVDNAELQIMFRLPPDSHWRQAVIDSIEKTVAREKQWAQPMPIGVLRNAIAVVVGFSPLYVAQVAIDAVLTAGRSMDFSIAATRFKELVAKGVELLKDKFRPEAAERRIATFAAFMDWFRKEAAAGRLQGPLNLRRLVALGTTIAFPDQHPISLKNLLNQIVYERGITAAELERRIGAAWKALGLKQEIPKK